MADGFVLTFTAQVDPATAGDPGSYEMSSFTYHRFEKYGSPEIDHRQLTVTSAAVSPDGRSVHLAVEGLRAGFVLELHCAGVRSVEHERLLHAQAYYTLNVIPTD